MDRGRGVLRSVVLVRFTARSLPRERPYTPTPSKTVIFSWEGWPPAVPTSWSHSRFKSANRSIPASYPQITPITQPQQSRNQRTEWVAASPLSLRKAYGFPVSFYCSRLCLARRSRRLSTMRAERQSLSARTAAKPHPPEILPKRQEVVGLLHRLISTPICEEIPHAWSSKSA